MARRLHFFAPDDGPAAAGGGDGAPARFGLSARQRDLLAYIGAYIARNGGVPPSYDEMCEALGLGSKSNVHRLVLALCERGYITFLPYRPRSIMLTGAAR